MQQKGNTCLFYFILILQQDQLISLVLSSKEELFFLTLYMAEYKMNQLIIIVKE